MVGESCKGARLHRRVASVFLFELRESRSVPSQNSTSCFWRNARRSWSYGFSPRKWSHLSRRSMKCPTSAGNSVCAVTEHARNTPQLATRPLMDTSRMAVR